MSQRPTVIVTWPDFTTSWAPGLALLENAGFDVLLAPKLGSRSPEQLDALLGDAQAAIVSTDPFTAEVLAHHPRLDTIARVGVGFDSIDIPAATSQGTVVCVTAGANEDTVADHTLGLMLASIRRIPVQDHNIRAERWLRTGEHMAGQLTGSTVGLIGYGGIGRKVARRLRGFDVRVIASDPVFRGDEDTEAVEMDELLAISDIVSLHVPLIRATHHLIAERELALMKPTAVLVNTGRGGVIDEDALARALSTGQLHCAALDVFEQEPPFNSPLLSLPNTVLSPHIAGVSGVSVERMVEMAVRAVVASASGTVPDHVVNPDALALWTDAKRDADERQLREP